MIGDRKTKRFRPAREKFFRRQKTLTIVDNVLLIHENDERKCEEEKKSADEVPATC
jgi:hypothetical protein